VFLFSTSEVKMTKEKNHRSLVLENPLEILIEMMVMMNEDHYQMMTKVRLYYMTKYPNIHHARNDIVDHKDLNKRCDIGYESVKKFQSILTIARAVICTTENGFVFWMSI